MNVLASAGSASELFLRQARAGVPLTVTDTGMMRFWITGAHAALVLAHGALLAADGEVLSTPHDPAELSVGELAAAHLARRRGGRDRRHRAARHPPRRDADRGPHRPGRDARRRGPPGHRRDHGRPAAAGPAWVAERLEASMSREQARAVWLEAMQRPGLLVPARS